MDLRTLTRQTKGKELYHKLPKGKGHPDTTSSKIWGIIYPGHTYTKHLAHHFIMGILNNNSSIETKSYNKEIGKILKSSGRALEYFLIDHLQRNKRSKMIDGKPSKINHRKGTFEQDTEDKIDFITTVSIRDGNTYKHIRSGIQLTTADDPEHNQNHPTISTNFNQKKKIVKHTDPTRSHIPKNYQPDIKGFMVVNGTLQKAIHQHNFKAFSKSFRQRRKDGFPYGGPGGYLPETLKATIDNVSKLYERSQHHMIKEYFFNKRAKKINAVQEELGHYIHIKHNPDTNELLYEFFDKQKPDNKYNFICSITYFLPTN